MLGRAFFVHRRVTLASKITFNSHLMASCSSQIGMESDPALFLEAFQKVAKKVLLVSENPIQQQYALSMGLRIS